MERKIRVTQTRMNDHNKMYEKVTQTQMNDNNKMYEKVTPHYSLFNRTSMLLQRVPLHSAFLCSCGSKVSQLNIRMISCNTLFLVCSREVCPRMTLLFVYLLGQRCAGACDGDMQVDALTCHL